MQGGMQLLASLHLLHPGRRSCKKIARPALMDYICAFSKQLFTLAKALLCRKE